MPKEEILNYIKQTKAAKFTEAQIKAALIEAGWAAKDVDEAFESFRPIQKRRLDRKIFLSLTMIVLLAGSGYGLWYFYGKIKFAQAPTSSESATPTPTDFTNVSVIPGPPKLEPITPGIKDCDRDWDCFIGAAKACTLARMTQEISVDPADFVFGVNLSGVEKMEQVSEIKGPQNDDCLVYFKNLKIDVSFPVETPNASQATALVKRTEWQDGLCRYPATGLIEMLERWKTGEIKTELICEGNICYRVGDFEDCEGTMFAMD